MLARAPAMPRHATAVSRCRNDNAVSRYCGIAASRCCGIAMTTRCLGVAVPRYRGTAVSLRYRFVAASRHRDMETRHGDRGPVHLSRIPRETWKPQHGCPRAGEAAACYRGIAMITRYRGYRRYIDTAARVARAPARPRHALAASEIKRNSFRSLAALASVIIIIDINNNMKIIIIIIIFNPLSCSRR